MSKEHDNRRLFALLGLVVVAGVIAFMALLGLVFTMLLQESLTKVIGIISPIAFAAMAVIGVLLMFNVKIQRKVRPNKLRNPYVSAFFYGFFFGAIVVPCNPLFIAAFFARVATIEGFVVQHAQLPRVRPRHRSAPAGLLAVSRAQRAAQW